MTEKKRILLAEDDRFLRDLTNKILSRNGYEVTTVANGEEAWERAQVQAADLIILDVCMPRMDGFEVARRLRGEQKFEAIPIIFLTARTDEHDLQMGYDAGAAKYVTKPFDNAHLVRVVREALGE